MSPEFLERLGQLRTNIYVTNPEDCDAVCNQADADLAYCEIVELNQEASAELPYYAEDFWNNFDNLVVSTN